MQLLSHLSTSMTLQHSIKGTGSMFSVRRAENKVDGIVTLLSQPQVVYLALIPLMTQSLCL